MITTGQVQVGLTPTIVDGSHNSNFKLWLHNLDNTSTIYLGNETVSLANGFALDANAVIEFELNPLESIYAVSDKTGHTISWMKQV